MQKIIKCGNCGNNQLTYKGHIYQSGYSKACQVIVECGYCGEKIWYNYPYYIPKERILKYLSLNGIEIVY